MRDTLSTKNKGKLHKLKYNLLFDFKTLPDTDKSIQISKIIVHHLKPEIVLFGTT